MLLRLQNSYSSMTSMVRQQERVANNLANANTIGYKAGRAFTEVLNERIDAEQSPVSDRSTGQWAAMAQGPVEQTGNPFDVALQGDGFFVLSDGATGAPRYTRAGRFLPDADGTLRDPAGLLVEGTSGPIQLPPNAKDVEIDKGGTVRANGQVVGQLRVVAFADPTALRRLDGAAFDAAGQEPQDVEHPSVLQGAVERSNVDPLNEMTEMIEHFRLFESQQKLLTSQDQVLGHITRDLGRF